jgi:hypothetical protein
MLPHFITKVICVLRYCLPCGLVELSVKGCPVESSIKGSKVVSQ